MPRPLDPAKRAAILAAIRAAHDGTHEQPAAAIARAHGVAPSTVSKIATQEDLSDAWNRSQTKRAGDAVQADARLRRAQLASDLLDDVEKLRARFFAPYKVVVSTEDGVEVRTMDEPPADAVRNYVTSAAVLIDKHLALERAAAETQRHNDVDAWLSSVMGGDAP